MSQLLIEATHPYLPLSPPTCLSLMPGQPSSGRPLASTCDKLACVGTMAAPHLLLCRACVSTTTSNASAVASCTLPTAALARSTQHPQFYISPPTHHVLRAKSSTHLLVLLLLAPRLAGRLVIPLASRRRCRCALAERRDLHPRSRLLSGPGGGWAARQPPRHFADLAPGIHVASLPASTAPG